jgi:PIN domain nuclease of toxin-antitoxin system
MRILLDTSIFLWMAGRPERLNSKATALLTAPDSDVWMSVVSTWEIVIKVSVGKLDLGSSPSLFIPKWQAAYNLKPLAISQQHALALQDLRLAAHRDPFDRMLIAQASAEKMVLITADRDVSRYAARHPVEIFWGGR